jgi:hypothetical protein
MSMSADLRKRLFGAKDIRIKSIEVPEWGGTYYVRVINGKARESFEEALAAEQRMKNFRMKFLILTLCDEDGATILTDADIDFLGERSSVVINRVFDAAWAINGFTKEAVDAMGEGSPSDQNAASTSV